MSNVYSALTTLNNSLYGKLYEGFPPLKTPSLLTKSGDYGNNVATKPDNKANHQVKYMQGEELTTLHVHHGSCHCKRVQFRIKAPKIINGVDVSTKVRFPRLSIPCKHYENLTEESLLSFYAVNHESTIGIYTFCSFCGVQILYSPKVDPIEIQVNIDCLDRAMIEKLTISYHASDESQPCPASLEASILFNRRGTGSNLHIPHPQPSPLYPTLSTLMHFQPGSHAYVYTNTAGDPITTGSGSGSIQVASPGEAHNTSATTNFDTLLTMDSRSNSGAINQSFMSPEPEPGPQPILSAHKQHRKSISTMNVQAVSTSNPTNVYIQNHIQSNGTLDKRISKVQPVTAIQLNCNNNEFFDTSASTAIDYGH